MGSAYDLLSVQLNIGTVTTCFKTSVYRDRDSNARPSACEANVISPPWPLFVAKIFEATKKQGVR